jgi:hypothetical protein
MDSRLVAKITVPRVDDQTRTGTAYPIAEDLLLTARHVIEFDERDKAKPITVEWQEAGEKIIIEPQQITFEFDGGDKLDVILLRCPLPQAIAAAVTSAILEEEKIHSRNAWETLGFPKVNNFNLKGATGMFSVDTKQPTIDLTLDDSIKETILQNNKIENGWGGMSGAPVFCIQTQTLQAIIIEHNQWMEKQLSGVSVPYLMKLPAFRQALGLTTADEQHKHYLEELPHRIKTQLQLIKDSLLYQRLAADFITETVEPSVEKLWLAIENKINNDPISLLQQYRNCIEAVLIKEQQQIGPAQTLFLLLLGFFSQPTDIIAANKVHQLRVRTRLAVEIYLAARYGLTPDLVYESKEDINQSARGRFAIEGDSLFREVGFTPEANAQELIKTANIAINKVHESVHGQKPADELDEFERESLDETIKTRRQGKYPQLIRVEVPFKKSSEQNQPLYNDDVCSQLREWLPNLPIVRYGLGAARIEPKLCAQVNEFFRIIKQYS